MKRGSWGLDTMICQIWMILITISPLPWRKGPELDKTKHRYVCHAELNAILNKNIVSLQGFTIYVSLFPFNKCAKIIVQSEIKKVVYYYDKNKDKPSSKASKRMPKAANVELIQFKPTFPTLVIDFESINAPKDSNPK